MKIPVIKSSMPNYDEYIEEIKDLWDSRWLTNMGAKHNKLINELKAYLKIDNIDLVTNGHMALELSLECLDLKGEVITTPFTFVSTTNSIVRKGCIPVFCDINEDDFTIDVNKIEELITDKTVAIMPVHVYGNICDVEKIDEIAKKHNLKVIYDAAHAFGEEYKGKGIMNYGDSSCMSFHATKVFHTIEGGAIAFRDESFGKKLNQLKDFGIKDEEITDMIGTNAKMHEFSAAMGLCNLKHIDEFIVKRKILCDHYRERLNNVKGIKLSPIQKDVKANYAYFPVFFDEVFSVNRDNVKKHLEENNVLTRKYFYPAINELDSYKNKYPQNTPIAAKLSRQVLTLPLYTDLTLEEVDYICDKILELY